jgi:hypothetical protein
MGYVLELAGDPSDTILRAMADFPLDALWLADWHGPLTVRAQLELRRLYLLTRAPLLVPIRTDIGAGDLECLRDTGGSAWPWTAQHGAGTGPALRRLLTVCRASGAPSRGAAGRRAARGGTDAFIG